jgi:P27 family predicted phage terminase small subunit
VANIKRTESKADRGWHPFHFKLFVPQTVARFFGDVGSSRVVVWFDVALCSSSTRAAREISGDSRRLSNMPAHRKTIEEKMLSGTLRGDRLRQDDFDAKEANQQVSAGRPKMPGHLSPDAVEAWRLVCKLLKAKGTLSKCDAATLEIYSEVKSSWIAAKKDVQARGQLVEEQRYSKSGDPYTVTIINPSVQIQRDSERQLLQLTKALGLAPDSREKVRGVRKKKTEADDNSALLKKFPFLLTPEKNDDEDL